MRKVLSLIAASMLVAVAANAQPVSDSSPLSTTVVVPLQVIDLAPMNVPSPMVRNNAYGIYNPADMALFVLAGDFLDAFYIVSATGNMNWVPNPAQHPDGQDVVLEPINWGYRTSFNGAPGSFGGIIPGAPSGESHAPYNLATPGSNQYSLNQSVAPGTGIRFVRVGCTYITSNDQQQGAYAGTLTLTAAYGL
jgi:hypothetical protein